MAEESNIEWTDATFNPWEGCQKVGPGCDNCYAENRNARFAGGKAINWGPGAPRRRTSASNWQKPGAWNAQHHEFFAEYGRQRRVFCASLGDWADNEVPPEWRLDLGALISRTHNLIWLLLTKRIGNANAMLAKMFPQGIPDNVWIGATIVNQAEADRDIPKLLQVPARMRFLSMEPLLGPVDLTDVPMPGSGHGHHEFSPIITGNSLKRANPLSPKIDWVIAGGESGPNARPMHPDWARGLRDQCVAAGVPFLFKQHGEWLPINQQSEAFTNRLYRSNRVAKLHEDQGSIDDCYGRRCTVDYTVVQHDGTTHGIHEPNAFLQGAGAMQTFKVGKKTAGRLLDGVEWSQFPLKEFVC